MLASNAFAAARLMKNTHCTKMQALLNALQWDCVMSFAMAVFCGYGCWLNSAALSGLLLGLCDCRFGVSSSRVALLATCFAICSGNVFAT